ncbi:hypothetical protein LCGC14_1062870 [marine sediment metagenome]|uniref:Uncharacterized protein n=1 Tax=marine sediment metagenome TaxID=412755 RepID=A0A0F9MQ83_9ZZZZ
MKYRVSLKMVVEADDPEEAQDKAQQAIANGEYLYDNVDIIEVEEENNGSIVAISREHQHKPDRL